MKKIIRISRLLTFLILGIGMILNGTEAFATDNTNEGSIEEGGAAGFLYTIDFPENQLSPNGYFDLKMTPSQEQKVLIHLSNPSSEKIIIDIEMTGARTNTNGVIEYGPNQIIKDESLKYDFEEIVSGGDFVELEPGTEKDFEIDIKMPEEEFDGLVVGGIQLRKRAEEDPSIKEGSTVVNRYAYLIAMVLRETDALLPAQLELRKVYPDLYNYRNAIIADISNIVADFVGDLTIETQIFKKGSDDLLYETKKTGLDMAPNSKINFPIDMNGEKMIAGTYRAKITATSSAGKWEWDEEFEITQKDADKFNEEDVDLIQEQGIDLKLVLMLVGAISLIIAIIFGVIMATQNRKKNKRMAKRQK